MSWTRLCLLNELEEGKGRLVEAGERQLAIFLDKGRPFVIDNYCPHAGGNLAGGFVEDGCAVCPWHYWAFRLENGELRDTSAVKVETYPVRITTDGTVEVEIR